MFTLRLLFSRIGRWTANSNYAFVVGAMAVVIDLAGLVSSSGLLLVGGILLLLFAVFSLGRDIHVDRLAIRELHEDPRPAPLRRPYESPYDTWLEWKQGANHAVYCDELDRRLRQPDQAVSFRRKRGRWAPGGDSEEFRRLRHLEIEFDEDKIRLCSDLLEGTSLVEVQKTKYSAFLTTNKLALVRLLKKRDALAVDAERVLFRRGRIPRLERSSCSNHIGVDVLAVADDGRVWIGMQSRRNQLSPGQLAPSGSGSADWRDLDSGGDLRRTVINAMHRELFEELGFPRRQADLASFRLLGYSRFTHLGGKPQFFGVTRIRATEPRIRAAEQLFLADHIEIDFDPAEGAEGFRSSLRTFERDREASISFPLYVILRYMNEWLDTDPEAAAWLGLA